MPTAEPWWEAAFGADYLRLYPHRDLESARSEAEHLVRGGVAGRVLDLGCGYGRHSAALSALGCRAVGLDLSAALLARGAETAPGVPFVRGDVRALPFGDASFDAVVVLFTSFGYFDEAGNARALDESTRLVRPCGWLVLDLMNPASIRAGLVPESRTEREGFVLVERRTLVDDGRRVTKSVELTSPEGERRTWHEDVRMFAPDEIAAWLEARGFRVERTEGDFDGGVFDDDAARQLVWARRRSRHS